VAAEAALKRLQLETNKNLLPKVKPSVQIEVNFLVFAEKFIASVF